jgi:hypothetical protein
MKAIANEQVKILDGCTFRRQSERSLQGSTTTAPPKLKSVDQWARFVMSKSHKYSESSKASHFMANNTVI